MHPYPIHHIFGPHVTLRFAARSTLLLLMPWTWKAGKSGDRFKKALSNQFKGEALLYAEGRQGLLSLLRAIDLKPSEEVIIQGYTCCVVANAVHAAGGSCVYADINKETLNFDVASVESAITNRTRAIICQNTFGIPGPLAELRALCDQDELLLIEDCAHALPDDSGPRDLTQYGDALMLSFSRDKAFCGITGGAIIARDEKIVSRLIEEQKLAIHLSHCQIARILLYPIFYSLARPFYGLWIGKAFLFALKKLHILMAIVRPSEYEGKMSPVIQRLPNACAAIALDQFKQLKEINDHRRKIAALYSNASWPVVAGAKDQTLALQKLPLLTEKADEIRKTLKGKNIHLDDGWAGQIVCKSASDAVVNYVRGSCPRAEEVEKTILSVPIHPTMTVSQTKRLIRELHSLLHA